MFKRSWIYLIALLVVVLVFVGISYGQEADVPAAPIDVTTVSIDWGIFVNLILLELAKPDSVAFTALLAVSAWVVSKLPQPLQWAWRLFQIEQLLSKSLQAAMNQTAGAVAGQTLTLDVANEVLAKAAQYAVDNGQKALIEWAGGNKGLHDKLTARVQVDANTVLR